MATIINHSLGDEPPKCENEYAQLRGNNTTVTIETLKGVWAIRREQRRLVAVILIPTRRAYNLTASSNHLLVSHVVAFGYWLANKIFIVKKLQLY